MANFIVVYACPRGRTCLEEHGVAHLSRRGWLDAPLIDGIEMTGKTDWVFIHEHLHPFSDSPKPLGIVHQSRIKCRVLRFIRSNTIPF